MKKWMTGLTIAGLLGIVSLAAQEKPAPAPAPKARAAAPAAGQRGAMPLERLKTALGLTDEQVAKLQENRKIRQEAQQAFRGQMQKLRGELAPLLKDPKADPNKINGLIDQIAKLGADQAKKSVQDRGALAKILTPEQMTKLQDLGGRGMGRGMGMGVGPGMGLGMRPGMGMRPGTQGMGRGGMMGRRGAMMTRPGLGRGMGPGLGMGLRGRPGMGFGPGLRLRMQRMMRGGRWIR